MANPPSAPPPDPKMARMALIHTLASCLTILTNNLEVLAGMQSDPESLEAMMEMAEAIEKAHRTFEALRKLV